jgi:hypothetical protein
MNERSLALLPLSSRPVSSEESIHPLGCISSAGATRRATCGGAGVRAGGVHPAEIDVVEVYDAFGEILTSRRSASARPAKDSVSQRADTARTAALNQ